jgi:hypothetical protein
LFPMWPLLPMLLLFFALTLGGTLGLSLTEKSTAGAELLVPEQTDGVFEL